MQVEMDRIKLATGLLKPFFQTPAEGARTAVYLATDEAAMSRTREYYNRCRLAKSSR